MSWRLGRGRRFPWAVELQLQELRWIAQEDDPRPEADTILDRRKPRPRRARVGPFSTLLAGHPGAAPQAMPAAAQPARSLRDTAMLIRAIVLIDSQIDHDDRVADAAGVNPAPPGFIARSRFTKDLTQGNPLFNVLSPLLQGRVASRSALHKASASSRCPKPRSCAVWPPTRSGARRRRTLASLGKNPHEGDTIGVVVEDTRTGRKLFYAPGLGEIEPHVLPLMATGGGLPARGRYFLAGRRDGGPRDRAQVRRARASDICRSRGPGGMWIEVLTPARPGP